MQANIPEGYTQTEVGVIPSHWEVKEFGELVAIRKQKIDPKKAGLQAFCIELEHIKQGSGQLLGYTDTTNSSSIKAIFYKDDILFGKLRAYLRKYWLADRNGVASTEIWPLVVRTNFALPEYIYQCIQTDGFIEAASMAYGTHMPRTDWNVIKTYRVSLPPLTEQKAIAQSLSDVDALITECDRLITKKRNAKQGMMQQLLTGKKRLPGFSGEWELKKFDNLTKLITCGLAATPKYVREEIGKPFLSAQNVRNGKVVYDNYRFISYELFDQITKYSKPQKGDLLYTRVGAGIGEAGVIEDNFEFGIYVSLTLIRTDENQLHNYFLLHLLNSPTYKSIAKNGQFAGGGVQNLNVQIVKEFSIFLPPLPEQQAIAQVVSDMDAEITALEQKRDKYKAIKQGMMQELLTGKTRLIGSY
ncbi:restriction endonuclease subunit S [Nostoc sp.]|uniref:restriction endonuclease subunit S n=1 Tax=Nostoc sp. TaxID=1180 RepID=UPI002FF60CC9